MKKFIILFFLLTTQLSYALTSNERALCSMSYHHIKELEAEFERSKQNLEYLKGESAFSLIGSTANLIMTGVAVKKMSAGSNMDYLPLIIYIVYTTAANYTTYTINQNDIKKAKEFLPTIEAEIAKAIELKENGCDPASSVDTDDDRLIVELEQTISIIKATQLEITNALSGQTKSSSIRLTGLSVMAFGFFSFALTGRGDANIGGPILIALGGIINAVGETSALGAALIDRGDLEKSNEKMTESLTQMNKTLDSLRRLRELKSNYAVLNYDHNMM